MAACRASAVELGVAANSALLSLAAGSLRSLAAFIVTALQQNAISLDGTRIWSNEPRA